MEKKQDIKTIKAKIWQACSLVRDEMWNGQIQELAIAFAILRRIDSVIAPFAEWSVNIYGEYKNVLNEDRLDAKLREITGVPFYNTSGFSFVDILAFGTVTMNSYLQSYSKNVLEILDGLNLQQYLAIIQRQERKFLDFMNLFASLDLSPTSIDNEEFLELISSLLAEGTRRTGINYTSLELSNLISECILAKDIRHDKEATSIYDPVCGTGCLLSVAGEKAKSLATHQTDVSLFGQEITMFPCAVAKALALLSGNESSQVRYGNTITEDLFPNSYFQYIVADFPFGLQWSPIMDRVEKESFASNGRFNIGLPKIADSQFLFIEHILSKMNPEGSRAAFITSSYVLSEGSAKSGESRIRRWLFENDLVETIIALPGGSLVYSSVPVYLWILTTQKDVSHKGKVRLIDASSLISKNRQNALDNDIVNTIISEYKSEIISTMSQILNNNDFGYYEINLLRGYSVNGRNRKTNTETVKISLDRDIKEFVEKERNPYTKLPIDIDYSSVEKGYEVIFSKFFKEAEAKIDSLAESSMNLMSIVDGFKDLNADLEHLICQAEDDTFTKNWQMWPLHAATKTTVGLPLRSTFPDAKGLPLITVSSLRGKAEDEKHYAVNPRTRCSSTKDAIIIVTGANSGEVFRGVDGILPSTLAVVKSTDMGIIAPEYLYYLLKGYEKSIQLLTRGGAIKSLNIKQLSDFKCLIPPIEEQQRIAAYLDGFVGKLDRIIASLNSTDTIVSTYRQTLIENIVRGNWNVPTIEQTKVVDGVEYVDLGLKSGTKWSSKIFVSQDGNGEYNSYFSHEEAMKYNIPTTDQFKELIESCEIVRRNWPTDENIFDFVGTSGKKITFDCKYYEKGENMYSMQEKYRFWLKGDAKSEKNGLCATDEKVVEKFKGNRFPIMLVR